MYKVSSAVLYQPSRHPFRNGETEWPQRNDENDVVRSLLDTAADLDADVVLLVQNVLTFTER